MRTYEPLKRVHRIEFGTKGLDKAGGSWEYIQTVHRYIIHLHEKLLDLMLFLHLDIENIKFVFLSNFRAPWYWVLGYHL